MKKQTKVKHSLWISLVGVSVWAAISGTWYILFPTVLMLLLSVTPILFERKTNVRLLSAYCLIYSELKERIKMGNKIQWKNTDERYGRLAMIAHWSVAFLFLMQYMTVYFRHWFTERDTDINWTALQLHLSFGITVAVFVALRILYKLWDKSPKDPPGHKLEHLGAKLGHWALYAVMIIMPVTGYLGTSVDTEFFGLFDITQFSSTSLHETVVVGWMGLSAEEFEKPIDFIHKRGGATLVWMLIGVHVLAALYHHLYKKDDVLRRMLPVKLKPEDA